MNPSAPAVPEDGIVVCSRCGRQVDMKQPEAEAFVCEHHTDAIFCSQTCLREHMLDECEDDL